MKPDFIFIFSLLISLFTLTNCSSPEHQNREVSSIHEATKIKREELNQLRLEEWEELKSLEPRRSIIERYNEDLKTAKERFLEDMPNLTENERKKRKKFLQAEIQRLNGIKNQELKDREKRRKEIHKEYSERKRQLENHHNSLIREARKRAGK